MRNLNLADVTLRESNVPGTSLSFKEKIEIAKLLDKLNLSVIETAPIENARTDALLVKSIASAVQTACVCVPVGMSEAGIDAAWEAVKDAAHPRLQLTIPMSPVQMEYFCHKKPPMVLSMIEILVAKCRSLCADVEFVAADATRSEAEFLQQAINAAINAGASTITLCDAAGTMLPDELGAYIKNLRESIPALADVKLGVQCSNELSMSAACAIAAIQNGCDELKVSACMPSVPVLEAIAQILRTRSDSMAIRTDLKITELHRAAEQIKWICEAKRSKTTPFDTAVQSGSADQFELSIHDDISEVRKAIRKLGYDLSENDVAHVFEAFQRIADKKNVSAKELDAIVASNALQVPPTYQLISYVINTGNIISATAHIKMDKDGAELSGISAGDGPIDAAFLAIEQIIGHHYELDDFQIQSVTEGREAMGAAVVRLRAGGKLYSGRGISTDIIGASIRAYLNALNKIVSEEA